MSLVTFSMSRLSGISVIFFVRQTTTFCTVPGKSQITSLTSLIQIKITYKLQK